MHIVIVAITMPLESKMFLFPTRTKNSLAYVIPASYCDYHLHSFFPRTVREWNFLPQPVVQLSTPDSWGFQKCAVICLTWTPSTPMHCCAVNGSCITSQRSQKFTTILTICNVTVFTLANLSTPLTVHTPSSSARAFNLLKFDWRRRYTFGENVSNTLQDKDIVLTVFPDAHTVTRTHRRTEKQYASWHYYGRRHKRCYYPPPHCLNVYVMLNNISKVLAAVVSTSKQSHRHKSSPWYPLGDWKLLSRSIEEKHWDIWCKNMLSLRYSIVHAYSAEKAPIQTNTIGW